MESLFLILSIFLVAFILIQYFRQPAELKMDNPKGCFAWPPTGVFDQEVAGESNYTKALSRIKKVIDEKNLGEIDAFLHPEDKNQHDPKAVAVVIAGLLVGYLPRSDARTFRKNLEKNQLTNQITSCKAKIFGGTPDKPNFGVWLDLQ